MGRTYAGGIAVVIPRRLWPGRPPTKVKEGTEIQYGPGSYSQTWYSTRQYGIAGESMLNFGILGVPLSYLLSGIFMSRIRGVFRRTAAVDIRVLFLLFLVYLCFIILVADSDNVIAFIVKNAALPFLVVFLSSRRTQMRREQLSPALG